MHILSPSMLSADYGYLADNFATLRRAGVTWIHIDNMDGAFVPNLSIGIPIVKSVRKCTDLFFDVHLMINEPIRYVKEFAAAGSDLITVHYEACSDLDATLAAIHERGVKAGLSIKPKTPVEVLLPYLDKVDLILMMSVEPGFGGQSYIPESTARIAEVRKMIDESGRDIDLEVDGGVNDKTVQEVLDAGANVIVAGSAVFRGDLYETAKRFNDIVTARDQA